VERIEKEVRSTKERSHPPPDGSPTILRGTSYNIIELE
jgi:hypothetical protein